MSVILGGRPYAAVIFDMDGVLIDSEPFWRQAEMEVFATVGVHLTEQQCIDTQGIRIDEVVAIHFAREPWTEASPREIAERVVARVAELVREHGKPMAGALEILSWLATQDVRVALATGSSRLLIETVLSTLEIGSRFEVIQSAEDEPLGKPHPAVYLKTAENLGVPATECLVVEDSVNGVVAAKAARMTVVAIPEEHLRGDRRYGVADSECVDLNQLLAYLQG